MSWLALILSLVVMAGAIKEIRDDRRRGVGVDWSKTVATAAGVLLVTASATGVLIGAMALGARTTGTVLFIVVFAVGLTALVLAVNRRWPSAKAR